MSFGLSFGPAQEPLRCVDKCFDIQRALLLRRSQSGAFQLKFFKSRIALEIRHQICVRLPGGAN